MIFVNNLLLHTNCLLICLLFVLADDLNLFSGRYFVQAGAGFLPPVRIQINTILDSVPEDAEGAILLLRFQESELDARDVGQVQLLRNSYLIRINESFGIQEPQGRNCIYCTSSKNSAVPIIRYPLPNN